MQWPTFTIITPSLNCRGFIERNLESVRRQGIAPERLEHWVIDGGSTDGTQDFLKAQSDIQWISEPDHGLSDAVNKGIQRATHEWIIWLNADDVLADGALETFSARALKHPQIRIFCGAQTILRYDGTVEQTVAGWDYNLKELLGCHTAINQASTFVHREVYQKVGLMNVEDRYTMDYEWTVRAMHHYICMPIAEVLTCYQRRKGSITDANIAKQSRRMLEIRRQYNQPRLSKAEWRLRFFIYTDWLRKMRRVRRWVRKIKGLFGQEPITPMN
jgi:glycosyltransferase involved in cell wall biosynthesis